MADTIKRTGTTARWSDAVTHNKTVYLCEVPANDGEDMLAQSKNLLALLDERLAEVGSDKSSILNVTIYITDRANVAVFNQLWEAWLPAGTAPVRACIIADLVSPGLLVEIQMIAAVH